MCGSNVEKGLHQCQQETVIIFWQFQNNANSPGLSRESPEYDTNLPVSRTGHHISRIKSSFELSCVLVWDLAYF